MLETSAAAAVVFREPDAQRVAPHLFAAPALLVPQLFHLELANVGLTKVRRGDLEASAARELIETVERWPLQVHQVGWVSAWSMARRDGLTVHDASYLHLATDSRLPLLTLDRRLATAAGRRSLL